MWGTISKHWHVVAATVFSVLLVVGAYVLAQGVEFPSAAHPSTETELLQAIATKDSNGDGLPDWEKVLYGIPVNATTTDYFHLGMTDGEAVARGLIVPKADATVPMASSSSATTTDGLPAAPAAGTITSLFAQNFMASYLTAKQANGGADLTQDQMNALATQAIDSLSSSVTTPPPYKTLADLTVSPDSSAAALKTFAINAEAILLNNRVDATSTDLDCLKDALLNNNESVEFPRLLSIANMYHATATGLAQLAVPQVLAQDDLALINALEHMSEIDTDFTYAGPSSDPLMAIIALQQYVPTMTALGEAFTDIGKTYAAQGVTIPDGSPGATIVNMSADVAASAAQQPPPTAAAP